MLKVRIITATILSLILLAGLFLLPALWSVSAFGLVFALGAWEWAGFGGLRGALPRAAYVFGVVLLMGMAWFWTTDAEHLAALLEAACVWWVLAFTWVLLAPGSHRPVLALFCGVPVLVPAFVALGRLQLLRHGFATGPLVVLCMIALVCAADIGAYFAGRSFGRHKLAPRVSPGKTWEGAIGGLLAVAAVAWGGAAHFGLPALRAVLFGCGVGVFSIIGDLTESMFKRAAGLKDSGTLLPGHGGLLDRMDSVTAAAPLFALGLFGTAALP